MVQRFKEKNYAPLRHCVKITFMKIKEKDSFWQDIAHVDTVSGHPLIMLEETASTNSDAMDMGRKGAETGTVVLAKSQSGGRGRLGKTWISPPGTGLYFSIILRPDLPPVDLPKMTLAAGVALCRVIAQYHLQPLIKWPNDLLLDGKKCGGILTESEFGRGGTPLVVLGIGLNIFTPKDAFSVDVREKSTSLHLHYQGKINMQNLLASFLSAIDQIMVRMEIGKFAEILEEWRALDATRGKRLTWLTSDRRVVRGISQGPDDEGLLHIIDDQGREYEVLSGDIQLQFP